MAEQIELTLIDPNPWQPRQAEDPEHIKQIALSIAEDGLMQIPIGRRVDGRVQLAFGHSRLAAFRWLVDVQPNSNIEGDYTRMPVEIRDLTDLQMFDMGIRENIARKDLSPIEEARAMQRYREDFGKTSKEIGELFGLSESAVRNKMRLLDLPDVVQAQVEADELSEMTARRLLSLQKVSPDQVERMAKKLGEGDYKTPSAVDEEIRRSLESSALKMWGPWNGGEPCGGQGLWPMDWDAGELELTIKEFKKLYEGPGKFPYNPPKQVGLNHYHPDFSIEHLFGNSFVETWRKNMSQYVSDAEGFYDLFDQLRTPPACTACRHYTKFDGHHFCGLQACHKRKKAAWLQLELERCVKELGIPAYEKSDGTRVDLNWWQDDDKKRFEERDPNLRLIARYREYTEDTFTKSRCVAVVEIGERSLEEKRKDEERKAEYDRHEQIWENRRINREKCQLFLRNVAAPVFAVAYSKIDSIGMLESLVISLRCLPGGQWPEDRKGKLQLLRSAAAFGVLNFICEVKDHGAIDLAKDLQGLATTWGGISLPADWMEQAERIQYDGQEPEPVDDEPVYTEGEEDTGELWDPEPYEGRSCRVCGCTDQWGCEAGCWWVEEDLCSECVDKTENQEVNEEVEQ
jgi:ParB/RepB/Spo0J family partition protein